MEKTKDKQITDEQRFSVAMQEAYDEYDSTKKLHVLSGVLTLFVAQMPAIIFLAYGFINGDGTILLLAALTGITQLISFILIIINLKE